MSSRKKTVLALGTFALFVLAAVCAVGFYLVSPGLIGYETELSLQKGDKEASIQRDDRGVAHIRGSSLQELVFAQGFAQAKDRLWQMELQRRAAQGRLSQVLGQDLLNADEHLRRMGLRRVAERKLQATSEETRQLLQSYARGVNKFIREYPLPPEFRLLRFDPEPWEPVDSASIVAIMAYNLGGNWREEALRQGLRQELDPELYKDIHPGQMQWDAPSAVPSSRQDRSESISRLLGQSDLAHLHLPSTGSNSWVIGEELSSTDTPVLANDPHLSLGLPPIWHECSLSAPGELELYGWGIPGAPGIAIGHNSRIAWGMTNIGDSQDLFLERRHPENPHLFKHGDSWEEASLRREEIEVRGREEPHTTEIVKTRHGPLISRDPPMSLRWTAHEIETSTLDAFLDINRARDWREFQLALQNFSLPVQVLVYADVEGNIGLRAAGLLPVRKKGRGAAPSPGWKEEYGWEGFIPRQQMPGKLNPEQGYLAAANHRLAPQDYPYTIDVDPAPPYRMQRITQFLESRKEVTPEESRQLQTDWSNLHAAKRLPEWTGILQEEVDRLSRMEKTGLELLQEWKGSPVNTRDSAAAAIFQTWYLKLIEEVFRDRLSDELWQQFLQSEYLVYNCLEHLLDKRDTPWLPQGLKEPLLASYRGAMRELKEDQGGDPRSWRWDGLQSVAFEHELGEAPLIGELLFNRGPHPYGGDRVTVGRASYSLSDPFQVNFAAGLRFVSVLGREGISTRAVVAGGQSGHPLSRHYDDQIRSWLEGDYYQLQIPDAGR